MTRNDHSRTGSRGEYVTGPQAIQATTDAAAIQELRDRIEVTDALYRFGLGQDLRDRALLASAFAGDAALDFRPVGEKLGFGAALIAGRDTIVDTIRTVLAEVDTTHVVTNPRVEVRGDTARLTAIVAAQHLRSADHSRFALLTNRYAVALRREGRRWVMAHVHITNVWHRGDPGVIFG